MAIESGIEHDDYLQQLSPGGTPSTALHDFIFQTFSIIAFILPTIKTITKNVYVRGVSERVLLNPWYSTNFTCDIHKEWGEKPTTKTVVNIFSITKKKHSNDSVRKEQIVHFEKKQGQNE